MEKVSGFETEPIDLGIAAEKSTTQVRTKADPGPAPAQVGINAGIHYESRPYLALGG